MLAHQVLWPTLVDNITTFPSLNQNEKSDVCIIGGGFTGLSAAIHLAEAGYSVSLIEGQTIGSGGSGRNVGLVNAGTWAQPDELNKYLGEEQGEKLTKALGDAPKLVFDTIDRLGIQAQDTRTGNLHMAHNREAEQDVDSRYAQLTRRGADVEVLTGAKCHEYCGTTSIQKALLDKRAGTVNPYAYVMGLAQAAKRLGVKIYENSPSTEIEKQQSQWIVKTETGSVIADKVVLSTNAYTQGEWFDLLQTIYFVKYYQIASEPLQGAVADKILPYKNGSWDTRLALSSIRRDKDGRLLLGTVGGYEGKEAIYRSWANVMAKKYFPELGEINWQCQWSGQFGFTQDHIMRIFEPQPGIIAATAFNGRGITTGTLLGKCFAQYLQDDDRTKLPLPFNEIESSKVSFRNARSAFYDCGIALYHAGQCLKVIS
ncbi:FAD-dependent oxidoreductase [Acinetobacter sp. YIM 103518]|uniref:FAD-dependent oxidoreductase n=1 Tax=Acinetobacter faecalis TaxID=2665161 RepID=A0A6L6GHN6_9GAMM|nr:FAD-binding oxidoreductase [Acinetobacter faecalis]MTD12027.1 FAD-dependent oxidoreductase [Acinetobacter faecalis]